MINKANFDPELYQRYVTKITDLVADINRINLKLAHSNQEYTKASYQAYGEHVQALLKTSSPLEYFSLNRDYMTDSSRRFQQLVQQRYDLFKELSEKLMAENNIMFLFPEPLQQAIMQFRQSGKMDMLNPEIWAKFTEQLTSHH